MTTLILAALTASEYAYHLNEQARQAHPTAGGYFTLTVAQAHWDAFGISTGQELADHLTRATFSDMYKERNGFRPRGWTMEAIRSWLANPPALDDDWAMEPWNGVDSRIEEDNAPVDPQERAWDIAAQYDGDWA